MFWIATLLCSLFLFTYIHMYFFIGVADAWFCWGPTLAIQDHTIEGKEGEAPLINMVVDCIFGVCCVYIIRGKIRKKYGLGDNKPIPDCIWHAYPCAICTIAQHWREMEKNGDKPNRLNLLGKK